MISVLQQKNFVAGVRQGLLLVGALNFEPGGLFGVMPADDGALYLVAVVYMYLEARASLFPGRFQVSVGLGGLAPHPDSAVSGGFPAHQFGLSRDFRERGARLYED